MTEYWRKIDKLSLGKTSLCPEDECYFFYDHVEGGYSQSTANQLIFNLKKPIDRRGMHDWHYKGEAIARFTADLTAFLRSIGGARYAIALAPMPTSKNRHSESYDDRIVQVVQNAAEAVGVPWLDCFEVDGDIVPSHLGGSRNPQVLEKSFRLNQSADYLANCDTCLLVDDILTTGGHYIACKNLLLSKFPHLRVVGVFWAKHQTGRFEYGTIDDF